jgi:putative sterol carrier protein
MVKIEDRFQNFITKIGQISSMVKDVAGDKVPDFVNMSLKANLRIGDNSYTLIIGPDETGFVEGHDPFTEFEITAKEEFWHDVFDGKYTFFGGYTRGLVTIPNFRPNRFKVFFISGMLSMLQNMKMTF